ncbi:MAG: hypothetical protein ACI9MC_000483 [Kiritimatiellia bacterium]|jgi:hypothetical protein
MRLPVLLLPLILITACDMGTDGLTVAKLETAKSEVHAMQPKADAMTKLTAALGEPSSVDDSAAHWYVKDGEKCKHLEVPFMGQSLGTPLLKTGACPK